MHDIPFIPLTVSMPRILQSGYAEHITAQAQTFIDYARSITDATRAEIHDQAAQAVKYTFLIESPDLAMSTWLEQDTGQNLRALEHEGFQRNARLKAFIHGPTDRQRVTLFYRDRFVGALPPNVAAWVRPLLCTGRIVFMLSDVGERNDSLLGGTYTAARITIGHIIRAISRLSAMTMGDGVATGLPQVSV